MTMTSNIFSKSFCNTYILLWLVFFVLDKKRAIRINTPEDNQTYSDTNFSTESNRKLGNNKYKMEFISNVSEKLRGIVTGRNKCNYYSWKPHVNNNSYSGVLTIIPIRRLVFIVY